MRVGFSWVFTERQPRAQARRLLTTGGWFAQRGFDSFASTIYTRIGDAAQGMPGAAAGSGGIQMGGPASAMDDMGSNLKFRNLIKISKI